MQKVEDQRKMGSGINSPLLTVWSKGQFTQTKASFLNKYAAQGISL